MESLDLTKAAWTFVALMPFWFMGMGLALSLTICTVGKAVTWVRRGCP